MGNQQCSCDNSDRNMQDEETIPTQKKMRGGKKLSANNDVVNLQENDLISLSSSRIIDRPSQGIAGAGGLGEHDAVGQDQKVDKLPEITNPKVLDILDKLELELDSEVYQEDPFKGKVLPDEVYKISEGAYYQGYLVNGKREDYARQVWIDGTYFQGFFQNDQAFGVGRLVHKNGDFYEGDFVSSKANGSGRFVRYQGGSYEGEFFDDIAHGKGKLMLPNGSAYEGDFVEGKMAGRGKLLLVNDDVYTGEFSDNQFHGDGKWLHFFSLFEKILIFEIIFSDDLRHLHLVRWQDLQGTVAKQQDGRSRKVLLA